MTCPTCGGLVITADVVTLENRATETKCINCGRSPKMGRPTTPRPEFPRAEALARPPTVEEMVPTPRCTKGTCPEPAAEDSVRCVKHRDMQRASNEAFAKKQGKTVAPGRKPGRPSAQTAQPKKPGSALTSPEEARRLGADLQADRSMTAQEKATIGKELFPTVTTSEIWNDRGEKIHPKPAGDASWEEWKFLVLAQLQDAERKLREKIDAVQHAILTIEAL